MTTIKAGDKIRVKTKEELGGRRPDSWNNSGHMDYLYGTEQVVDHVGLGRVYVRKVGRDDLPSTCWSLKPSHVELLSDKYHKYHEFIVALAEGKDVEYRNPRLSAPRWRIMDKNSAWALFCGSYEFRMQPEKTEAQLELEKVQEQLAVLQKQAKALEAKL